jgi:RNA polymerase sigma-70 factor (ECF subfamily)
VNGPVPGSAPFAWDAWLAQDGDLRRFLVRRAGWAIAADLVQEVYLRLRAYAPEEVANHRAYVFRVAHAVLVDHQRRENRHRHRELAYATAQVQASPTCEPLATVERRERLARVQQAIAGLPPVCRRVFLLSRVESLTYPQIAERLGIAVSTVEKHVLRALASCRASVRNQD